jgi:hypothetical protein
MRREREGQLMRGRIRIAAVGPRATMLSSGAKPHRLARSLRSTNHRRGGS